jgi:hypothetical protein|tara:strand:+ start:209 stop:460 length:252 start_codon:yes stop_codon:yes gene_type:complete
MSDHRTASQLLYRTASQLLSQREAACTVQNFAQPIILAYGTCASAKFSRHWSALGCTLIAPNTATSTIARVNPPMNFEVSKES